MQTTEPKQIQAGQTLTARSVCDHECVFTAKVVERKGNFVKVETMYGLKRVKVRVWDGCEFIYALGQYSMAPMFRAQ